VIAGRTPLRLDGWALYALAVSVVLAIPVIVVTASLLTPFSGAWRDLAETVLPLYVRNSIWMMLGVGCGVTVIGVGTAWLTTMTRFPLVRQFEWALIVPLAMPAYVIAYT
jgi:iron(III) transport system permease protein